MTTRTTDTTTRHTETRRTGSTATAGQWWKFWILLAGVGTTVLGWTSFPREEKPLVSNIISRSVSMPLDEPMNLAPADRRTALPLSVRRLPATPQKPVFRAPVTRTRRS